MKIQVSSSTPVNWEITTATGKPWRSNARPGNMSFVCFVFSLCLSPQLAPFILNSWKSTFHPEIIRPRNLRGNLEMLPFLFFFFFFFYGPRTMITFACYFAFFVRRQCEWTRGMHGARLWHRCARDQLPAMIRRNCAFNTFTRKRVSG